MDGSQRLYLEDDAEEPGEEDVAGHQPSQLPPVLLAVADPHRGGAQGGRPRKQAEQGRREEAAASPAACLRLNSGLHQPLVEATNTKIVPNKSLSISCKEPECIFFEGTSSRF